MVFLRGEHIDSMLECSLDIGFELGYFLYFVRFAYLALQDSISLHVKPVYAWEVLDNNVTL